MFRFLRHFVVGVAVALLAVMPGCAALEQYAAGVDKPSARVTGASLGGISLTGATMIFDVEVQNPYSAALPLVNLDYALASGGQSFLSGKAALQGSIPAKGSKTVAVPAEINFARLLEALKGVRAGSVVPYRADIGFAVDAPVVGRLRVPVSREGQLPVPAAPEVSVSSIKWGAVSLGGVSGELRLNVKNTNQFAVDLSKLAFVLNLAGHDVASAGVDRAASFSPGGEQALTIPLSLSTVSLGTAILDVVRGRGSGYTIGGDMSVGTPFGPMNLPFKKSGQTTFSR